MQPRLPWFVTLAALALGAAIAVPSPSCGRTMQVQDLRQLVGLTDPQLSPDGRWVAVLVSHDDYDKDRYDSELVLVSVAWGTQRVITYDRTGLGSPRWSPGGDQLAFIAQEQSGDSSVAQVFVMPMNGGDPMPVTHAKTDVQQFAWRPDGGAIAYVAQDEAPKRTGEQAHDNGFDVGDNDYLFRAAVMPSHLWVVN
ncbi:MAG TPA: hypothetical protein VEJ20_04065, partial [Candidatus Eremiobacteraceae bacterium]|nr:hypothetical protein [Candidatus Eremiobacteraceae bacterium]